MEHVNFEYLDEQIQSLIIAYQKAIRENALLAKENKKLMGKNQQAATQIKQIISRLKSTKTDDE